MIVTSKEMKFVSFEKGVSSFPSDDALAKINHFALEPLTKEEVYTRSLLLCHNGIDLDNDRFNERTLGKIRDTLIGKGFFLHGHPGGWFGNPGPGDGRFFESHVNKMTKEEFKELTDEDIKLPRGVEDVHVTNGKFYLPRLDSNRDDLKKMDAGVTPFVSVGFMAEYKEVSDPDDEKVVWNEFLPEAMALEGSVVWLGAQPGASIQRNKYFNIPFNIRDSKLYWGDVEIPVISEKQTEKTETGKENVNEMKELVEVLKAQGIEVKEDNLVQDLVTLFKGYEAKITELSVEKTPPEPQPVNPLIEIGAHYQTKLVDECVRFKGILGDITADPDIAIQEKAMLKGISIEHLERTYDQLKDRVDKFLVKNPTFKMEEKKEETKPPVKPDLTKPEQNELFATLRI